jgi:hypothetical protein
MTELAPPLIFIDTNIYLRFFDSSSAEYRRLLTVLEELKPHIFVTRQIVSEVARNKLFVASNGFDRYLRGIEKINVKLPIHFDTKIDSKASQWNESWNENQNNALGLKSELQEFSKELIEQISKSIDAVSKCLESIFDSAFEPSAEEIQAARLRKELGNPPGKKTDPIGDELSWEQLLNRIDETQAVWIVSDDGDFFVKWQGDFHLNSFLRQELEAKMPEIEIKIFNSLGSAISAYKSIFPEGVQSAPSETEMKEIQREEESFLPADYAPPPAPTFAQICPNCQQRSLVSQFFPAGYILRCFNCAFRTPMYDADDRYF